MASELDEIWALYQDDGGESLRAAEEALETLAHDPAEREAVAALFRALHTFKGNSRILGLVHIERVAHHAEDLIGLVRDRGIAFDAEIGATLLETVDVLRGMMERAVAARADDEPAYGASISRRLQSLYELRENPPTPQAPDAEPEPANELDAPAGEVVYFDSASAPIGEDEGYLQIFLEFAGDALAQMQRADPESVLDSVRAVGEAAERLGLNDWRLAAEAFVAAPGPAAAAELGRLYRAATGGQGVGQPLAQAIATLAPKSGWPPAAPVDIAQAAYEIAEAARGLGLLAVADVAEALNAAQDLTAYEEGLFELHDGLRLWVETCDPGLAPALEALGRWCAAQGAPTLGRLALALNGEPAALDWTEIAAHVRRLSGILAGAGQDEAVALAARVADLVARLQAGECAPDAAASRALNAFVAALKPLVGARPQAGGEIMRAHEALDDLFRPRALEEQLAGLDVPAAFLSALSPEGVQAAAQAASAGLFMHVVRADTERRPELAEAFYGFVSKVRVIGTLTVFDEEASLFDFLIACPQDGAAVAETLAALDPDGSGLRLLDTRAPPGPPVPSPVLAEEPASFGEMLETLGTVVTAQASARRLAERLSERGPIELNAELDRLAQLQAQIGDNLERLQQEVMASQLRPAAPLMQELRAVASARARARGVSLAVTIYGEESQIDGESLVGLAFAASTLVTAAVDDALTADPPTQATLTLSQNENRVSLTLRFENAGRSASDANFSLARSQLRGLRGEIGALENGEPGFRLILPRALALIDGMVMRVGAVRYIAPIRAVQRILRCAPSDRISVSASGGAALRIDAGAIAPIVRLPQAGATPQASDAGLYVIVSERGELAALEIDEIIGQEPLLVRPLAGYLGAIGAASGCAVLADGSVGVSLDLAELLTARALAA